MKNGKLAILPVAKVRNRKVVIPSSLGIRFIIEAHALGQTGEDGVLGIEK